MRVLWYIAIILMLVVIAVKNIGSAKAADCFVGPTIVQVDIAAGEDISACLMDGASQAMITFTADEIAYSAPKLSERTMPTPPEIAEAIGAGFIVMLPLMMVVWGGRQLISMFRTW